VRVNSSVGSGADVLVPSNPRRPDDPTTAAGGPAGRLLSAVVVNVTATGPTAGGWLTVYPSDQVLPVARTLNFSAGQTVANLVKIRVGADGKLKITNTGGVMTGGTVNILADIVGYYQP
jgi:hypothetical protein